MCSPNWFGTFHHKVSDMPEMKTMTTFPSLVPRPLPDFILQLWRNSCKIESGSNLGMRLHIFIFHSVGCFVDAIWKIESDFQLPFTYLLAVFVKIDNIIVMHMRTTCSCVGATRCAFLLEWIHPLAVFSSNFILLTVLL